MHELYRMLGNEREADMHDDAAKFRRAAKASPRRARRPRTGLAEAMVGFVTRLRRTSVNYEVKEEPE